LTNFNFKPKQGPNDYGWAHRGYLRHFDGLEHPQFVTFRLADSLPQTVLQQWSNEKASDAAFRKRLEKFLDAGHGECWLRLPHVARIVREAIFHFAGVRYELIAWVIMPNHVHLLIRPLQGNHLPEILHSIKSFTAQNANKILGRSGTFWQRESFDRYTRNARHFAAVVRYIENNPVKAGLCGAAEDWEFSSAFRG
jgi:putative DNA methylase